MDGLIGIDFATWRELLRENGNKIDAHRRKNALKLTAMSMVCTQRSRVERRFDSQVAAVEVESPLFIIGHWRSGTTLLHSLMAQDDQHGYPRIYQVSNPRTFLSIPIDQVMERFGQQSQRQRPMDSIVFDPISPAEDEFAMSALSIRSNLVGWSFLRREAFYDRFLTFREAPPEDYARWRQAFLWFLKKVQLKEGRRLMLKSPQHTGRIRLILEEFPRARFVHIHRNPYAVFRSTERLYHKAIIPPAFQEPPPGDFVTEGILRRYREIYDAFFEERSLIPAGQYAEVSFEALEQDMVGQVAAIYEQLQLPGFGQMAPQLQDHVASLSGYRKNVHPEIETPLQQRIYAAWQRSFDEWGYAA